VAGSEAATAAGVAGVTGVATPVLGQARGQAQARGRGYWAGSEVTAAATPVLGQAQAQARAQARGQGLPCHSPRAPQS